MRVLLTGGTGFIGSHICMELLEKGHAVKVFDNLSNSSIDVVCKLKTASQKDVDFVKGDIRCFDLLDETIRDFVP
ncbi:GDP-mannose 4,6-dehydratase, partial [Planktomarina temperata]|nr:GDP-mannose 4,6-dehydratase [Planktomarina temperata]